MKEIRTMYVGPVHQFELFFELGDWIIIFLYSLDETSIDHRPPPSGEPQKCKQQEGVRSLMLQKAGICVRLVPVRFIPQTCDDILKLMIYCISELLNCILRPLLRNRCRLLCSAWLRVRNMNYENSRSVQMFSDGKKRVSKVDCEQVRVSVIPEVDKTQPSTL